MTSLGRSQSGGQGKHAGRSIKRTMQRRNHEPRRVLLAEAGRLGVATPYYEEEAWYRWSNTTGWTSGPPGVGSTARMDGTGAKVGKVSRVASALPHSEGAAYKQQSCEDAACLRDWRMGSIKAMRERDSITRTGAEDPWGREAEPRGRASRTAVRGSPGQAGLWASHGRRGGSGRRATQTGPRRGYVGSRLNRQATQEGAA